MFHRFDVSFYVGECTHAHEHADDDEQEPDWEGEAVEPTPQRASAAEATHTHQQSINGGEEEHEQGDNHDARKHPADASPPPRAMAAEPTAVPHTPQPSAAEGHSVIADRMRTAASPLSPPPHKSPHEAAVAPQPSTNQEESVSVADRTHVRLQKDVDEAALELLKRMQEEDAVASDSGEHSMPLHMHAHAHVHAHVHVHAHANTHTLTRTRNAHTYNSPFKGEKEHALFHKIKALG